MLTNLNNTAGIKVVFPVVSNLPTLRECQPVEPTMSSGYLRVRQIDTNTQQHKWNKLMFC